jgi:site-specific DNA recombinase
MIKWKDNLKSENVLVRYKSKQLIGILKDTEPKQDFDIDLFYSIIEKMTVFEGKKILVSLLDGT